MSPAKTIPEWRAEALASMERGDAAAAEHAYRAALALDPRDIYALVGLGLAARAGGNRAAALEHFEQAAADWPEHPWPLLEIGAEHEAANRLNEAETALRSALTQSPAQYHVLMTLSRLMRKRGESRQAAEFLLRAAMAEPTQQTALAALEQVLPELSPADLPPGHWLCLADLFRARHRLAEAEAAYRNVLDALPADLAALGGLAIVHRGVGDAASALALLDTASALDPKNDWIGYERGITLRELGQAAAAQAALEAIAPGSTMFVAARMALGHMARADGAHARALACFEAAAGTAADPTEALAHMAAEKRALGDLAGAGAVVATLLARYPGAYRAHMEDGQQKRALRDFAGARAAFAEAASLAPAQPQPLVELAYEDRRAGDLPAALANIEAALRNDPLHEDALLKQGLLLTDAGRADEALAVYAKLRAARPGSVWAYLAASQLLGEQGELDAARDILAAARQTCAKTSELELREASLLQRHGLLDEAFRLITVAQARYPLEFAPWLARTQSATELGMFDLAEALLSAPPALSAPNRARLQKARARLYMLKWQLEAAKAEMDAALALGADDAEALYERARLRLITFDLAGARADLVAHAALRSAAARRQGRSANLSQSLAGQLYEEFALDPELAATAAAVQAAPDAAQDFMALVQGFPNSTAPAIGLMIALRRTGRFARPAAERVIPQRITQFWSDRAPPPDIQALMQSWAEAQPEFQIEVFDDAGALAYLRDQLGPRVARVFEMTAEPAQRADLFRLARLFHEGGYYVDADDRARGGLGRMVAAGAELFCYQEEFGTIGNNVLGAAPGHPVIGMALEDALAALARDDREIVWLSTGPGLLTRCFARWLAAEPEGMAAKLAGCAVLTLTEMRGVAAMVCHAAYKNTERAWLNAAFAGRKKAS